MAAGIAAGVAAGIRSTFPADSLMVATAEVSLLRHFHLCNGIPEVALYFSVYSEKRSLE